MSKFIWNWNERLYRNLNIYLKYVKCVRFFHVIVSWNWTSQRTLRNSSHVIKVFSNIEHIHRNHFHKKIFQTKKIQEKVTWAYKTPSSGCKTMDWLNNNDKEARKAISHIGKTKVVELEYSSWSWQSCIWANIILRVQEQHSAYMSFWFIGFLHFSPIFCWAFAQCGHVHTVLNKVLGHSTVLYIYIYIYTYTYCFELRCLVVLYALSLCSAAYYRLYFTWSTRLTSHIKCEFSNKPRFIHGFLKWSYLHTLVLRSIAFFWMLHILYIRVYKYLFFIFLIFHQVIPSSLNGFIHAFLDHLFICIFGVYASIIPILCYWVKSLYLFPHYVSGIPSLLPFFSLFYVLNSWESNMEWSGTERTVNAGPNPVRPVLRSNNDPSI